MKFISSLINRSIFKLFGNLRALFGVFGSLAQYERALAKERINAGLEAAKKRGRRGGRPNAISDEKLAVITEALNSGVSKASICRTFGVKRTTLYDALKRITQ